jgi:predicted RNA binding protein YcfA (HicA-like mRNA interferase family)
LGKQVTTRDVLQGLKQAGFIKSANHNPKSSHQRYIHKTDNTRFADISFHRSGQVVPKGTLKNIEKTSGVSF